MVVCAELSRECEATYNMGSGGGGERATVPYTSLLKYLLAPDGIWVKKSHRLQFYIHWWPHKNSVNSPGKTV